MKRGSDIETSGADGEGALEAMKAAKPRGPMLRRAFLALAAAGAAGVAAGAGALAWRFRHYQPASLKLEIARQGYHRYRHAKLPLAEAIVKHFDYLTFDPAVADRFAGEYQAVMKKRGRSAEPLDEIYSLFLLSTDFFQNGADEGVVLRYVMLYDPHESACYNPFATFA